MTAGELETMLRERVIADNPPISGKVYYKDMRPRQKDGEPHTEDCEVFVLTGSGSELVEGTCVVNVYVYDTLTASGIFMRTKARTDAIEKWANELPSRIRDSKVYFKRDGIVTTLQEEATNEHFVSLKMRFKVLQNNY